MNILGIETSCDDTSAAVVVDGWRVASSVVSSQIKEHSPFGGVVPEIASRRHVENLPRIISESLRKAEMNWAEIDAVAVTKGPGLASSLITGLITGKALAHQIGVPLWSLNHLEAHIYSVFLDREHLDPCAEEPILFLTVSGGHTNLVMMRGLHNYQMLGTTLDDAAGEALDKGAKMLGFPHPGGPSIESAAKGGDPRRLSFPQGRPSPNKAFKSSQLKPQFCFSFSGVKTSLLYHLRRHPEILESPESISDVAASYQSAVFKALTSRIDAALKEFDAGMLACAGGVMRNKLLRSMVFEVADSHGVPLQLAQSEYCTDNAAMVAGLAGALRKASIEMDTSIDVAPRMPLTASLNDNASQSPV